MRGRLASEQRGREMPSAKETEMNSTYFRRLLRCYSRYWANDPSASRLFLEPRSRDLELERSVTQAFAVAAGGRS